MSKSNPQHVKIQKLDSNSAFPNESRQWVCDIEDCKKPFAREADLRRHQRTTKDHNAPSYECQACHRQFTRPDALKRHQKSGHHARNASNTIGQDTVIAVANCGKKPPRSTAKSSSRSRRTRSLSPRPFIEMQLEFKEQDRRRGKLPPLENLEEERSCRSFNRMATCSRQQTHSSSLNAILASPISTPRLQPAVWQTSPTRRNDIRNGPVSPPASDFIRYTPQHRFSPPPKPTAQAPFTPVSRSPNPCRDHSPMDMDVDFSGRETRSILDPSPSLLPPITSAESDDESWASDSEEEIDELDPSDSEKPVLKDFKQADRHNDQSLHYQIDVSGIRASLDHVPVIVEKTLTVLEAHKHVEQQRHAVSEGPSVNVAYMAVDPCPNRRKSRSGPSVLKNASSSRVTENGRSLVVRNFSMRQIHGTESRRNWRSPSFSGEDHHADVDVEGFDDSLDSDESRRSNVSVHAVGRNVGVGRLDKLNVNGINESSDHRDHAYELPLQTHLILGATVSHQQ